MSKYDPKKFKAAHKRHMRGVTYHNHQRHAGRLHRWGDLSGWHGLAYGVLSQAIDDQRALQRNRAIRPEWIPFCHDAGFETPYEELQAFWGSDIFRTYCDILDIDSEAFMRYYKVRY